MAALFSFSRRKVQQVWEYPATGIIWRLLASPSGYLIGEDRNKDDKTVSFFCIHLESGDPLWRGVRFEESWWVGLEAIHQDVVFIHEYATPDLPEHKKIHAIDMMTGRQLWENDQNQFLFASGDRVFTARDTFERRVFSEFDLHTGRVIGEVDTESMKAVRMALPDPEHPVQFPEPVEGDQGEDSPISRIVNSAPGERRRVVYTECMERNNAYIISFYDDVSPTKTEAALDQHFIIAERDNGKTLFYDVLNREAKVPVPDGFFGKGNRVYYIKEKKVLHAVEIPPGS